MFEITTNLVLWGLAGLGLVALLAGLVAWRIRSSRTITAPPRNRPARSVAPGANAPRFEDLVPDEMTRGGFSAQLQTDRHNLRIERVGGKTRFVGNGVAYESLEDIPDPDLRQIAARMRQKLFSGGPLSRTGREALRQVNTGNQTTLEARSPDHTISIHRRGRSTRFIVNGMTYQRLNDISDPELRQKTAQLLRKMV